MKQHHAKAMILMAGAVLCCIQYAGAQGTSNTGTTPRDRAYDVIRTNERNVVRYEHLRESDVFFEKRVWRVIDVKEK
jgi:hypothetical protein